VDAFEAVRTVLAVRAYQPRPIPESTVRRILEAAHLTASSRNGQPWHFIAAQDPAMIKRLGEVASTGPYLAQAPLVVVVALEESQFAESDAGRAIQSMVLTAWSEGIGSNWVGWLGMLDGVKPLLGIPEELQVIGILPFGYPADESLGRGKKRRRPFGEVVHRERFDQPYE
jgi:nitroreductase